MQKGNNLVLLDRIVDTMSFKNVQMIQIPAIITQVTISNPSRIEAKQMRQQSYEGSPALQREFIRK